MAQEQKSDLGRSFCIRLRLYCLALGVCLLISSPLLPNHYFPWTAFHSEFLAFAGLAAASVSLLIKPSSYIPGPAVFSIFVLAIPLLQYVSGIISFFGDAYISSLYLLGFVWAICLGCQLRRQKASLFVDVFAAAVLLSATISAFLAIYQWLGMNNLGAWVVDLRPGGRPYGNLAQPNNLGLLLCLGLGSIIYFYESQRLNTGILTVLGLVLVFGLVLCQSKTPWLIALVFLGWFLLKCRMLALRLKWWHIAVCFFVYIFLWYVIPDVSKFLLLDQGLEARKIEAGVRSIVWSQLLDALIGGPWWGYGWNQVSLAQIAAVSTNEYSGHLYVEHSHNLVLDILLWNGPLLGVMILTAISYWGTRQILNCRNLIDWYWLFFIAAVMTHSMVEFPHQYAFFMLPVGLAVGALDGDVQKSPQGLGSPRWAIACFAIVSCSLMVITFLEYRVLEEDVRLARFESANIGRLKSERVAPNVRMLSQLRGYLALIRSKAKPGMSEAELVWMGQVAHRYAYPPAMFRYILALSYNNKEGEASQELVVLKRLHGNDIYIETLNHLNALGFNYYQ